MSTAKSWKVRMTDAELVAAVERAAKALHGSSMKVTKRSVASRVVQYGTVALQRVHDYLDTLEDEKLESLGIANKKMIERMRA